MGYVHDIFLNFHDVLYDFFEWNEEDDIVRVKKVPVFLVSDKVFYDFVYNVVVASKKFLDLVCNKTEFFDRKFLKYVFILSNGESAVAFSCDKNGKNIRYSSLLLDEEVDVCNCACLYDIFFIDYSVCAKEYHYLFSTRYEKETSLKNKEKLIFLFNNKEDDKIKYLYFDCFNDYLDDISLMFNRLYKEITCFGSKFYLIEDFFSLIEQK